MNKKTNYKANKMVLRILAIMLCATFLCGFAAPVAANASNEDAEVLTQTQGDSGNNENDGKVTEEESNSSGQVPDVELSDEGSDIIPLENEAEEELLLAEPLVQSVGPVKAPPLKATPSYMTMYLDIDSAIPEVQQFEYYLEYTGLDFNYDISTKQALTIPNSYGLIKKTLTIAAGSRIPISVEYYKSFYVKETPINDVHTYIQLGSDAEYEGREVNVPNIWYDEGAVCFKHRNEASSGKINVTKTVTGNAPAGQTYQFSVVRHNGTYRWVEEIVTLSAGQTSATIPYTHTTEFGATPQIWIAELNAPAGATASYTVNGSPASAQTRGLHERFLQDVCGYDNSKLQRYQNLKWVLLDTDSNCPDIAVVCTNAFPEAPKTAEVTVSKTVTGSLSDLTKEFDFAVSYTDKDGNSQKDTFKLKNGGSRTITVQTGSKVTVTESGADEYKTSYTVDSGSSKNGKTCTLDKVSGNTAVNFKNTYEPTSTSVILGGTKTLTGFPETGTAKPVFTFTLSENGKVIDTKTVTKQGDYAFNKITYTQPGEHTYTVAETKGSQAGVTYDTKTYTVKVTVTDNKAGALVAVISGDSTSGTDLDFTNSYSAKPVSVQFSGLKTLEGRDLANAEFSFTLRGYGTTETVKNGADGKIAFTPITFYKVGTYTYTVREDATTESGITIDSTVYNITVTVTDDGSGQLKAAITDSTGTITGKALNFKNTYKAGSTSVTLGGTKTFTGFPTDSSIEPVFTFTLSEDGKVIDTKTVTKQGDYAFNKITYTEPGEHTYTIAETKGSQAGVTYDTKTYTVTVKVTDNMAGALVAVISGDSTSGTDLNFTNSYSAKPVSVQFSGLKTLEGRELANEEFSFTLTGSGNKNETVKNAADGKITFEPITYTEAGTYTYIVREEATTESGVTIDSTVYNITVTVTDDGSGQLKAVITDSTGTITGKALNFKNTYKAGSTSVTLGGTKTLTGFPENVTDKPVFTFTLSEDGKVIDTKTVTKQGGYAFDSITYTEPGEHVYTVAETKGSEGGVTYDTKTYTVKVTVTDNKAGALVAAITGDSTSGTDLDFTNSYSAKPVSVQFSGLKTLEGRELANEEFSFTLTGSGDKNETVKNAADGKITFEPITYTKAGTYTYEVKEEATREPGVTIDTKTYKITVTVTDDGSGQLTAEISGDTATGTDLNFKNTYKAGSTSVALGGTKTLTGFPADSSIEPVFTFTLSEDGKVIDTKTVTKQGGYAFDSITYTEPGEHTYTIAETKGSQTGVTYDTKTYTVKVKVTDNKAGALVAAISGDSTSGTDLDFTNSYSAKPVSVQFGGLKTLEGKTLEDKEFSFTLTGSDGTNETVTNDANGGIIFSEIEYTKPGTYTYTVREEASAESGVSIDSTVYNITVTITDDGSGQLAAVISGDTATGTDLNFKNTFSYGSLAISKKVTGDLGDKNREFSFKVEFDNDGCFSYSGSKSGTLESGDIIKLRHGESIVISGIPAGTTYRVTELGANGYYTYSTGDNGLIFANSTSTAAFTNTRSSVPKTGDSADLNKWLGLTAACMVGLLFMAAPNKKKHGKHEV